MLPQAPQVGPPPQVVPAPVHLFAPLAGLQQGWPMAPQDIPPCTQPPFMHVPGNPFIPTLQACPAPTQRWPLPSSSTMQQPPALQTLAGQQGWPGSPQAPGAESVVTTVSVAEASIAPAGASPPSPLLPSPDVPGPVSPAGPPSGSPAGASVVSPPAASAAVPPAPPPPLPAVPAPPPPRPALPPVPAVPPAPPVVLGGSFSSPQASGTANSSASGNNNGRQLRTRATENGLALKSSCIRRILSVRSVTKSTRIQQCIF
jgi:hypothetical protein